MIAANKNSCLNIKNNESIILNPPHSLIFEDSSRHINFRLFFDVGTYRLKKTNCNMTQTKLSDLLPDQSKDLIWMINPDFQLIFANSSYLSLVKMVTGKEPKLYESAFIKDFGESYI